MKYPVFFGASLAFTLLGFSLFMIIIEPAAFLQDPFSVIGNLPNIYPVFITLGILCALAIGAFVYGAFNFFDHDTKKVKQLVLSAVLSGILLVIIPYNKTQLFYRWSHTVLAVGVAVIIVLLSIEFNKIRQPTKQVLMFVKKYTPPALSIGTFSLFITSGITMLMETYFIIVASIWLLVVGITIKEKQSDVELLDVEDKP